jgi:cytochrome P450
VQGNEAIQAIYGPTSKWAKPPQVLARILGHGVLRAAPSLSDVICRHILEPSFTSEAIAAQQQVILNCADTALTVTEIACESDEGKVDVLQIARTYAFDIISWNTVLLKKLISSGSFIWWFVAGTRDTFGKESSFEYP